jgi:hypothetical protein
MGNYKYKLKEIEVGTVKTRKGTKSTVRDIDPETGAITWDLESVPDYDSVFEKFEELRKFIQKLAVDKKEDSKFKEIATNVSRGFNEYRTHLRKNYPKEYSLMKNVSEDIAKRLKEMSSIGSNSGFISGGEGENHTGPSPRKSTYGAYTQAGFKKVEEGPGATFGPGPKAGPEGVKDNVYVKNFKYKLVNRKELNKKAKGIEVKQLWESDTDVESYLNGLNVTDPDLKKFISSRLLGFDKLERKLNELLPLLQQAKHETMDYYRENPDSFNVLYGTDLANDYVNDLIELFKKQ